MLTDAYLPALLLAYLLIGLLPAHLWYRSPTELLLYLTYFLAVGRRKQTIVTDAYECRRQDVHREQVKEIHGMHCHILVYSVMPVVLPVVCHHAT